jgi:membrane protein DedA with SNARE-associated domain
MFDALKIVLYGLLNVYNDGENTQKGCGCLTIIALLVFAGIFTLINESKLPDSDKVIFYVIILVILVIILIWMICVEIKNRKKGK